MKRIILAMALGAVIFAWGGGCASSSNSTGTTGSSQSITNPASMNEPVTKRAF